MRNGLVLWVLWLGVTAFAQVTTPLMMWVNGQLYRLDGENLTPYTECQPPTLIDGVPIVSPNQNQFAMMVRPPSIQGALDAGEFLGELLPREIWLCDHQTQTLLPIATNALNPRLLTTVPYRSDPIWSPDGAQLAWLEVTNERDGENNLSTYTLVVYNITTMTLVSAVELANFPQQDTGIETPRLFWTPWGIHILSVTFGDGGVEQRLFTYELDGAFVTDVLVAQESDPSNFVIEQHMILLGEQPFLAVRYASSGWSLVHLLTGQPSTAEALLLTVKSIGASNDSNVMDYSTQDTPTNLWSTLNMIDGQGRPFSFSAYGLDRLALSPDGTQIAFLDTQLRLWNLGTFTDIPNTVLGDADIAGIAWGALVWQSDDEETLPLAPQCEGLPISRLGRGMVGRVVSTTANNVRNAPSRSGELIGQISSGNTFTVELGPVCRDGFAWYKITSVAGLVGWTAEGNANDYWLAPEE